MIVKGGLSRKRKRINERYWNRGGKAGLCDYDKNTFMRSVIV